MDIEWSWVIAGVSLLFTAITACTCAICSEIRDYGNDNDDLTAGLNLSILCISIPSIPIYYIACSILSKDIKMYYSIYSWANIFTATIIIGFITFIIITIINEERPLKSAFDYFALIMGCFFMALILLTIISFVVSYWKILCTLIIYNVSAACIMLVLKSSVVKERKKRQAERERQRQLRQAEQERQEQLRQAEQERQEQLRQAEREREWQEHLDRLQQAIQKAILRQGFFNLKCRENTIMSIEKNNLAVYEMTKSPIIIDTNIWMDDDLDCFFKQLLYCCQINKVPVVIPGEVYEEIVRMTDKRNHYDNTEKVLKARIARKRILEFDNADLLYIDNLRIMHYESAYADPAIIELCKKSVRQAKQQNGFFYLLTNDKDLQLRVKHLSGDNSNKHCRILSIVATEYAQSDYAKNFQPSIPADFHRTDDIFNYLN